MEIEYKKIDNLAEWGALKPGDPFTCNNESFGLCVKIGLHDNGTLNAVRLSDGQALFVHPSQRVKRAKVLITVEPQL